MRAKFTEKTVATSSYQWHSGQMVEVRNNLKYKNMFTIRAEDGWEGDAYPHELSECSPELSLLIAKLRILGDAS